LNNMNFNKDNNNTNFDQKRGFTIVEVLIALSVFLVVIVTGIGGMVFLSNTNAKAQEFKLIINNLNHTLESMTRDIRFGRNYYCLTGKGNLGKSWTFLDRENQCPDSSDVHFLAVTFSRGGEDKRIAYRFKDDAIKRQIFGEDESFISLTSDNVVIENLKFSSSDFEEDDVQPRITVFIEGRAILSSGDDEGFKLQTTISQRRLKE